MAIQNVTLFTCDGCKTTEQRNLKKDCDGGLSEVVLPPYWLEVNTRAYPRVGRDEIIQLLCTRCATLTRTFFNQLPGTRRMEDAEVAAPLLASLTDTDFVDIPIPNKPVPPYVPRKG